MGGVICVKVCVGWLVGVVAFFDLTGSDLSNITIWQGRGGANCEGFGSPVVVFGLRLGGCCARICLVVCMVHVKSETLNGSRPSAPRVLYPVVKGV